MEQALSLNNPWLRHRNDEPAFAFQVRLLLHDLMGKVPCREQDVIGLGFKQHRRAIDLEMISSRVKAVLKGIHVHEIVNDLFVVPTP